CSMKLPPCETMQPFKVLPVLVELEVVPVVVVFWPAVLCPDMEPGCEFGSGDGAPPLPFPPLPVDWAAAATDSNNVTVNINNKPVILFRMLLLLMNRLS